MKGLVTLMLCSATITFLIGIGIGKVGADASWEIRLVQSGHAEYYLDKDNCRQWRMKGDK